MKGRFLLDYLDENDFKKLERSLKKYNMMAYKNLPFIITLPPLTDIIVP